MNISKVPLGISCLLFGCSAVFADDSNSSDGLAEVVVNATRSDTKLEDVPLHTTIVSKEELEHSPAPTIDQVLRQVPGLLIPGAPFYTTDPTGNNITFRGLTKSVLVLVDGVPIIDPFYTTIQWFRVPLSEVDRVEVVRGGGSAAWGNLAVGGVINIVTTRPQSNDGEASFTGASMGTYRASINKDLVINDYLSLALSADTFQSDGYDTAPRAYRSAFWPGGGDSSASGQNVRIGAYFQPTEDLSGFFRAGYHVQKQDIGGYAYGANDQKGPDFQGGVTDTFDASSHLTATIYGQNVNFTKYNGAGCYVATPYACGAFVGGSGASMAQQAGQILQYATSFDENPYLERGGSLIYSHAYEGLLTDAQFGADYRHISGEDSQQSFRTPTLALPEVFRVQRTNYGAGEQTFYAVFSQIKLRPIDPLEITIAAREDRYQSSNGTAIQTDYSNAATPVAGAPQGGAVPSSSKTRFDPTLSLRYQDTQHLSFRGSVYEAFRAPGLNNLYRSFGSSSITIANPLLGPETLIGKEVGLDWRSDRFSFGATVFQENATNVVATYQITRGSPIPAQVLAICGAAYSGVANVFCPGTVNFNTNGQDERSNGVELDAQWQITRDLNLAAYATGTQAYYTSNTVGDPDDRQLPLVPRYVAGGNLTWVALRDWTQFVDIRYNSAMTLGSLNASPLFRQGGYTVVDLSSTYNFGHGFAASVALQNLLDKTYTDTSASVPQGLTVAPPRTISVTLRQKF
jgi:outer membrane receptor protein involved in Fe transport